MRSQTDYRGYMKSKLAALDEEQKWLLETLLILDEADKEQRKAEKEEAKWPTK